ncbi:MAG: putative sulfate exporter family transporter [Opitutae bacterium]|nr:putative sulfate exporter family transporter [Opitutae bacterium]
MNPTFRIWLLGGLAAACCLPGVTPPLALGIGLALALTVGNPRPTLTVKVQQYLLQASVVGLGFGLKLDAVGRAGLTGTWATALSLALTVLLGWGLARMLKVERITGQLITAGTAICGGSAIAAMGPVLGASPREMSVSLGCVFILNAVALFVFPGIGHWAGLAPVDFGYWAALAIHDTSSVVGAAARYAPEALATAVPVKLARALWILPLVALAAMLARRDTRPKAPWFVGLFLLASATATYLPAGEAAWGVLTGVARKGLTVTLFLIGAGLSREALREVGWRPFLQAVILWVIVSVASLGVVRWWGGTHL